MLSPTTPPAFSAFIPSLHASLHIFPQTEREMETETKTGTGTGTGTATGREIETAMPSQVSCCEFHFRCDILLQNFIFNLCTYYTQLATPLDDRPIRWPTYPAFVFIFSEIVLFLPWQWLRRTEIRKAASVCVQVRVYLSSSAGLTPPLGLLIIITSIMTGFHWAGPRIWTIHVGASCS